MINYNYKKKKIRICIKWKEGNQTFIILYKHLVSLLIKMFFDIF